MYPWRVQLWCNTCRKHTEISACVCVLLVGNVRSEGRLRRSSTPKCVEFRGVGEVKGKEVREVLKAGHRRRRCSPGRTQKVDEDERIVLARRCGERVRRVVGRSNRGLRGKSPHLRGGVRAARAYVEGLLRTRPRSLAERRLACIAAAGGQCVSGGAGLLEGREVVVHPEDAVDGIGLARWERGLVGPPWGGPRILEQSRRRGLCVNECICLKGECVRSRERGGIVVVRTGRG